MKKERDTKPKGIYEELPTILKLVGTASSICGFTYLFSYTRMVGIPFPLELSVLPTAMLLIGTVALFGTLIVFGSVLYPMYWSSDPSLVINIILQARDAKENRARTGYTRYFVCYWIPMALTLLGLLVAAKVFDLGKLGPILALMSFISASALILYMWKHLPLLKGQFIEYIATITGQIFVSVFSNFMGVLIAIALIPEFSNWEAWAGFLIVLSAFTAIHIPLTVPTYNVARPRILLPPYFESKTEPKRKLALIILLCLVLLSVFIYPTNAKIGKAVLANFSIGGGIPVSVCLKDAPAASITRNLTFSPDKCSEAAALILDAGDRVYIAKIPSSATKRPSSEFNTPPIYIRQDQILQKIYLTPPPRQ